MAFGYNQPMYGQQPYYQPPMGQLEQLRAPYQPPAQQQTNNGVIWVQGEAGAKSYMVAPGNTVMLLDSEDHKFYLKTTDATGVPSPLRTFTYTETTQTANQQTAIVQPSNSDFVTRDEFNALVARVNAQRRRVNKEVDENAEPAV